MQDFDVIVIGAGSGLTISSRAAQQGLDVAVVEPGPFGGTCLNRGCIPSKVLIHTGEVARLIRESETFNLEATLEGVDFSGIVERTFDPIDEDAEKIEQGNRNNENITVFKEEATFTGERTLDVGGAEIRGEKIVVAAGTRPFVPPIDGIEDVTYYTSDDIMRIEEQPDSLAIIGGGYISAELGHFFGALGTDITIIEMGDTLVGNEDGEIADAFTERFAERYNVILNAKAQAVEEKDGNIVVYTEDKDGNTETVEADALLVAAGRVPNTDTLEVENASIETTERGFIKNNDYLETSADSVWTLGDIAGNHAFKHAANLEAEYVWINAFTDRKEKVDDTTMPHAIFSHPEVAGVGLTEEQCEEQDLDYTVGKYPYEKTGRGMALQEEGFAKAIVEQGSGKILGFHMIGPHASTAIHEVLVAMRAADSHVNDILDTIHIHPALNEVVERAFAQVSW